MPETSSCIEVAVGAPLPKALTYEVPETLAPFVSVGKRVLVPLGRRLVTGYVLGRAAAPEGIRIRPVRKVLDKDPLFPASQVPFFRWIADYYLYPLGQVISQALPSGLTVTSETGRDRVRTRMETVARIKKSQTDAPRRMVSRRRILQILDSQGEMPVKDLRLQVPGAAKWLQIMAGAGEVELFEKEVYRDPFGEKIDPETGALALNAEQAEAFSRIGDALGNGFATFLLNGVTGSGKTRVYLQAASRALEKQLCVIVLVPEIALITQMERAFRARFGERVAVLHSGLSDGERLDQWLRVTRGEAPITIGARSALFAPYGKTGLIIVDEEHDESYKQENMLRYHARDLAVVRAKFDGAVAVLGSATPSLQSLQNAARGKFAEIRLTRRVQDRPHPAVEVVDLRSPQASPRESLVTPLLRQRLQETLDAGEQAILFLNRRGYANFPLCPACGKALCCENCDISLTFHHDANVYQCHYCGFERSVSAPCPSCGSHGIQLLGAGTEKIEQYLKKTFPDAAVARLDRDSLSRKGALVPVLKGLRDRGIDILVGTQMVTKGHDFSGITLVGIVCADLSLGFPDFRAGERTFQLLAQVSGRAGRGEKPGRVVLQTFNPEHFCIAAAQNLDFQGFCKRELAFRRSLGYPPFARLAQLRIQGADKAKTAAHAVAAGAACRRLAARSRVEILGPILSPIGRINRQYRWQILIKSRDTRALRPFLKALNEALGTTLKTSGVHAVLDVDPVNML